MTGQPVTPCRAAEIETWADEADVVVVGFGAAGASAAIEAVAAGAEVLVLDRAGAAGGAAAMSDGFIYLGGGTPEQHAAGYEDSIENMKTFLRAACGPAPDEAKIDAYCDSITEHREWLLARGVRFLGTVFPHANGTSPVDGEGLMFTGGENAWPYNEIATPAPRGHVVQGGRPSGGPPVNEGVADGGRSRCARGGSACIPAPPPAPSRPRRRPGVGVGR